MPPPPLYSEQWRNVAPVAPAAKMYHTSAKLTFDGGKKYLGTKSSRGRQKASGAPKKPIRKTEKKVATFFLYFAGAPKISAGGAEWKTWLTLRH